MALLAFLLSFFWGLYTGYYSDPVPHGTWPGGEKGHNQLTPPRPTPIFFLLRQIYLRELALVASSHQVGFNLIH
jgi:hypothetical protein